MRADVGPDPMFGSVQCQALPSGCDVFYMHRRLDRTRALEHSRYFLTREPFFLYIEGRGERKADRGLFPLCEISHALFIALLYTCMYEYYMCQNKDPRGLVDSLSRDRGCVSAPRTPHAHTHMHNTYNIYIYIYIYICTQG